MCSVDCDVFCVVLLPVLCVVVLLGGRGRVGWLCFVSAFCVFVVVVCVCVMFVCVFELLVPLLFVVRLRVSVFVCCV